MSVHTSPFASRSLIALAAIGGLAFIALPACHDRSERRTVVIYETRPAPPPPPPPVYEPPPVVRQAPPPPPTVIYEQAPPPQRTVIYEQAPPAQQQTVVVYEQAPPPVREVTWEEDEVNYVVYREYYGCTEEEVVVLPHYRRYYQIDDGDLFFLFFVARHAHVSFEVAFHEYHDRCGCDYDRLVLAYRLNPAIFFVDLPSQVLFPTVYSHPYACYRSRQFAGVSFSSQEYRALIALKIGVEYQGHPPEVFFRHTQTFGSPMRVIYQTKENCGRGHQACAGLAVRPALKPWQLQEHERVTWRAEIANKRAANEPVFRQQHQEQIKAVAEGQKGQKGQVERAQPPAINPGRDNDRERGSNPHQTGNEQTRPPLREQADQPKVHEQGHRSNEPRAQNETAPARETPPIVRPQPEPPKVHEQGRRTIEPHVPEDPAPVREAPIVHPSEPPKVHEQGRRTTEPPRVQEDPTPVREQGRQPTVVPVPPSEPRVERERPAPKPPIVHEPDRGHAQRDDGARPSGGDTARPAPVDPKPASDPRPTSRPPVTTAPPVERSGGDDRGRGQQPADTHKGSGKDRDKNKDDPRQ